MWEDFLEFLGFGGDDDLDNEPAGDPEVYDAIADAFEAGELDEDEATAMLDEYYDSHC